MNKITILLVLLVFTISCENEEVDYRNLQINAYVSYHSETPSRNYVFKGIPVEFRLELKDTLQQFPDIEVEWDFGDGEFSTLPNCFHTYNENGYIRPYVIIKDYNNTIKIVEGNTDASWHYSDYFHFNVVDYPQIIGSKEINEKGEFIFQNLDNSYSIISLYEYESGKREYHILCFDEKLVQILDKHLSIGITEKIKKTLKNKNGNIIIITNTKLYEYSPKGELINSKDLEIEYSSIIESIDGYILAGIIGNNLRIDKLNEDATITNTTLNEFNFNNYELKDVFISSTDGCFAYLNNGIEDNTERSKIIFYSYQDGISWERNFDLESVLNINYFNKKYYVVGKNKSAGIRFEFPPPNTVFYVYSTYPNSEDIEVLYFEEKFIDSLINYNLKILDNDGITYFYNNMRISKNSDRYPFRSSGFEYPGLPKCYGYIYDVFNDVIFNNKGNYVMLGTKQVPQKAITGGNVYNTDLLLIETDIDGNPVVYN